MKRCLPILFGDLFGLTDAHQRLDRLGTEGRTKSKEPFSIFQVFQKSFKEKTFIVISNQTLNSDLDLRNLTFKQQQKMTTTTTTTTPTTSTTTTTATTTTATIIALWNKATHRLAPFI